MQLNAWSSTRLKIKVMAELKLKFEELENRVQKLIHLHKETKAENAALLQLNKKLESELKEEKERYFRLEEGLTNLKETERNTTNRSISGIKQRINDMVSEIDRSVALISEQNKK
jgi:predicted nuclease with TOPRIM domain